MPITPANKVPNPTNEMIIFNHAKSKVVCNSSDCSHLIAEPAGGKAFIDAEIIEELK